jgi:hypothetical protein
VHDPERRKALNQEEREPLPGEEPLPGLEALMASVAQESDGLAWIPEEAYRSAARPWMTPEEMRTELREEFHDVMAQCFTAHAAGFPWPRGKALDLLVERAVGVFAKATGAHVGGSGA